MVAQLSKIPPHRLSERSDPPSKQLRKLFHRNHIEHAVLRDPQLILHNHVPHALGSSYLLGASASQLGEIFDAESKDLVEVVDARLPRNEITVGNWREFLCKKEYTVSYAHFFDTEVTRHGGNWMKVVEEYIFAGPEPIIDGFSGGLGHSFIHLAYAYEFDSGEIATEALSLGCTEYDPTHKYLDNYPLDNSTYKSTDLKEVLLRVRADVRFDGYSDTSGFANIITLRKNYDSEILQHWNAWVVKEPHSQLKGLLQMAAELLMEASQDGQFDFYLAHVLTVAHALLVLLPHWSTEQQVSVMRQYGMYAKRL